MGSKHESHKWMILIATVWLQAFTGTNFDFSAYSAEMKMVLGVSQVQLSYLATASDMGKVMGWSAGVALKWNIPLPAVAVAAAGMGFVGYGVQWLIMRQVIAIPYFVVLVLCLLSGCSICWFNTVCFILCIKNFQTSNRPLALSLTISFNGLSAALYNLAANSLDPSSTSPYLLLNALIPLIATMIALIPILCQQESYYSSELAAVTRREQSMFFVLGLWAVITGLYLLLLHPSDSGSARFLFSGAMFLLILPIGIPGMFYAREWFDRVVDANSFLDQEEENLELQKDLLIHEVDGSIGSDDTHHQGIDTNGCLWWNSCKAVIEKDRLSMIGEEHKEGLLIRRLDFWLYFLAYFCGGTIGLVYSNNIGQIAQSLGYGSLNARLITIYSSFSFFGRLLSSAPDVLRRKLYLPRTEWLVIALVSMPTAFFLLSTLGTDELALEAGTAMIGLSCGFIITAAVSITAELFGSESFAVNHNILITNIPIGSLLYGFLAAIVYDSNADSKMMRMARSIVCVGRNCYFLTFVWWGCISVLGFVCSYVLFLRTRMVYVRFEQQRCYNTVL